MVNILIGAVVLAVLACLALMWASRTALMDSLMDARAGDAAQRAASDFGVVLDFSPASLDVLEHEVLAVLHRRHLTSPMDGRTLRATSSLWAAYVGAVLKRQLGTGRWHTNSRYAGREALPFTIDDDHEVFVAGWIERRITGGPAENVAVKTRLLLDELMRASLSSQV